MVKVDVYFDDKSKLTVDECKKITQENNSILVRFDEEDGYYAVNLGKVMFIEVRGVTQTAE